MNFIFSEFKRLTDHQIFEQNETAKVTFLFYLIIYHLPEPFRLVVV